jgi:hypothetical protein
MAQQSFQQLTQLVILRFVVNQTVKFEVQFNDKLKFCTHFQQVIKIYAHIMHALYVHIKENLKI